MSAQAKYCGSDRRCMVHVYTYAKLSFISMLKASINSRQVSVNLLSLVLGRNVEDAAVKL